MGVLTEAIKGNGLLRKVCKPECVYSQKSVSKPPTAGKCGSSSAANKGQTTTVGGAKDAPKEGGQSSGEEESHSEHFKIMLSWGFVTAMRRGAGTELESTVALVSRASQAKREQGGGSADRDERSRTLKGVSRNSYDRWS